MRTEPGETPLGLAACTKNKEIVELLIRDKNIKIETQDEAKNTVLHVIVETVEDSEETINIVKEIYEKILMSHPQDNLENKRNKDGLTPLQLAAQLGKKLILKFILSREITDSKVRHLRRKTTQTVYGPTDLSDYDMTGLDTPDENPVLHLIVYNSNIKNRLDLLELQPLKEMLDQKWKKFARHMLYISILFYILYNCTLSGISCHNHVCNNKTLVSLNQTECGKLFLTGHVLVFIYAILILIYTSIQIHPLRFSDLTSILSDVWFQFLFILQAILVIISSILYWARVEQYHVLFILAVLLGWTNMVYFIRGFRVFGTYGVMLQKVIVDVTKFLLVYGLFLVGFGVALSILDKCIEEKECTPYNSFKSTVLALFKISVGLGSLETTKRVTNPTLYFVLLVLYIILTIRLLLSILIALMGESVSEISKESEKIRKLQDARIILDFEKLLMFFNIKIKLGEDYENRKWIRY
ncbi:transient receptor potential cation channel subfamily V member 3-like [Latimeria chalumnae]|uniref:transient receptor potential cation channel subfamily V member 3-like n=1 Tax=Latimeria chalumnae TaxID=7897 RepID=UPI00313D0694